MLATPAKAMSPELIVAVTFVALTKVVVSAIPLKFTTEVETKPVPFTVSVKPNPPADALPGDSDVIVGTGLLTVRVVAVEVPPPGVGLATVTLGVPAVAISPDVIAAVTC